jgi:GNAT superfamily N-acetyltransferase
MARIAIRVRKPADDTALAALLKEMQAHYGAPCPPRPAILESLARLPPGVEILVAETDRIIGFAAFSAIWPGPGLTSGLFLKELFVTEKHRGAGAGSALMRAVAQYAVRRGHKRVDLTTNHNDPRLLAYYESRGALLHIDKAFCRLTGEALTKLAGNNED